MGSRRVLDYVKVREPLPGVFVFRLPLGEGLVRSLQASIKEYRKVRGGRIDPPNSMNKYGLILGGSLREAMAKLQADFVTPLAVEHYGIKLKKNPYSFVVNYEIGKQRSLAAHFDSSDVTLNLCLEQRSKGGELVFYDKTGNRPKLEIVHRVGQVIVHRGSHVHRAKPIVSGSRSNLILWCAAKKS